MTKPSTPAIWAGGKVFGFQPSSAQQAQGFDYIATVRPATGAPITDDHDWPLNNITTSLKWVMDQLPDGGIQALLTTLLPKRSFAGSDFIRIPDVPGGLIIQWGTYQLNGNNSPVGGSSIVGTCTLPAQFPSAHLVSVPVGDVQSSTGLEGGENFVSCQAKALSSVTITATRAGGSYGGTEEKLGVMVISVGF